MLVQRKLLPFGIKRVALFTFIVGALFVLLVTIVPASTLAESEKPAPSPSPSTLIVDKGDTLSEPSAANAALLLRRGEDSDAVFYWDTAQADASQLYRLRKATDAMLNYCVGNGMLPVGRDGIRFQPDPEVPLIQEGEELIRGVDFNIRGSVYSDSPITSVTASMTSLGDGQSVTQTDTFDPTENILGYSLDTKVDHSARKGLNSFFDISKLPAGRYQFTLIATSEAQPEPVTLYNVECSISTLDDMFLTQNNFDGSYSRVYTFFKGDTSKFLFQYWIRDGRNISTDSEWREATIVESSLGRVNIDAVPYFNLANYYLENTYVCVTIINHKTNRQTDGRVTLLSDLISKKTTYVPRFQSNLQYISRHTLGLAIDVNDDMYPNKNIITNQELIGIDVRDHLIYNGIKTSADGVQYYDFTYDGSYSSRFERVPKTIINYLLYELAFFRAGFQWGYYYEGACDGMHFGLEEYDINRHMYSDIGLRKIYVYIEDNNVPTLDSLSYGLPTPIPEE